MKETKVHPTAIVHPKALLGEEVFIGPYCFIGSNVSLGDACFLHSHITIDGYTTIGKNAKIYPYASIGLQSQDLKYKESNKSYTKIGNNAIIREFVSIHSGTDDNSATVIGNSVCLLTLSHIGHNCQLGDNVIVSHSAGLAGHVFVGNYANIGAKAGVHQHCIVGTASMIAAMAKVTQDILPFCIVDGNPATMKFINKIGMERFGYSKKDIEIAMQAFRIIFMQNLRIQEAKKKLLAMRYSIIIEEIIKFLARSIRGLIRL